jgi:hypothetical protein
MPQSNLQSGTSMDGLPAPGRPAEPPAAGLPAPPEGAVPATNGAERTSVFAPAWNKLRSASWVKRIADSATVRALSSTLKKAFDDTQAGSQHDDKKRP